MKKRLILIGGISLLLVCALALVLAFTPLGARLFSKTASGLILSVEPAGMVSARAGAQTAVQITAAKDAAVSVRLGETETPAVFRRTVGDEAAIFDVTLTFPNDQTALALLDKLYITATKNGKTETVAGPRVVLYAEEMTTELPSVGNQIPESENTDVPGNTFSEIDDFAAAAEPVPLAQNGQLCMVTGGYADTWNADPNDDTFFPFQTTLAPGTIDFAVGQSQVYDPDGDDLRSFYVLSSGRKVRTDAVQLLGGEKPNSNTLRLISSEAQNGALVLRLQTAWNVPYDFSFAPQEYYAGTREKFTVSAFTASAVAFTFRYTTAASGAVNAAGSDVISGGAWSLDAQNQTATLTLSLREQGKYYGYILRYDADGTMVLTIRKRPKTLSGAVVMLDPGHGGVDSGALGFSGAVHESQVNFALAVAVKNALERRGAAVWFTRTSDVYLSLEERKAVARSVQPDVFLSIHCNAAENPARFGTGVYYYRPMSFPLASALYTNLLSVFRNSFYAGSSKASGAGEGVVFHPFSVTRLEECPSVLIETGFITNNEECMLLLDANNRDKIAEAVAAGLESYFG